LFLKPAIEKEANLDASKSNKKKIDRGSISAE